MIDMSKKYKTRDGRAVRVLCVDRNGKDYPVVALVPNDVGQEMLRAHTGEGRYLGPTDEHDADLIEILPSVVFWVNAKLEIEASSWVVRIYDAQDDAGKDCEGYDIIARRVELPIEEQE